MKKTVRFSQNAGIPKSNVIEADEKMVADCKLLGNVQGIAPQVPGRAYQCGALAAQ